MDEYTRKYDSTKCLILDHSDEKCERIFDSIRYDIMLKSNISDICSDKYMKIKINLIDDLPL